MGIVVALFAACFWAISARFYRQSAAHWSVLLLNFAKNFIAVLVLASILWISPLRFSADLNTLLILILSGVIGIGIGDSALFAALKSIGEHQTLLIAETLAPLMVLLLAFLWLSEQLSLSQLLGIFAVLIATDVAIGLRRGQRLQLKAVAYAVLAALCQATGALISRFYLSTTELGVLESAIWRLLGGLLFAGVGLGFQQWRTSSIGYQSLNSTQASRLLTAILLGTVLGVFMLQWSLDLLPAGLAQTLLASSPLFAIGIAWILGESVSRRQMLAVIIGLFGVSLISLGL